MTTTKATAMPANFNALTGAEMAAAVEAVRSCRKGERCEVFGVEVECTRRGWFQVVGGVPHDLRSKNVVTFIFRSTSLRHAALTRKMAEVSAEIWGA